MSPHILVVDDAATVRMYHRKILADAGWQVDEAANGVEALERAAERGADDAFALYVVDVNMPKMDGYRCVRTLRRQGCAAPVLMISTEAQLHDAEAAREAGANAYLVKPVPPEVLRLTAALLLGDTGVARAAAGEAAR